MLNNGLWVGSYGKGTLNVTGGGLAKAQLQFGLSVDGTGQGTALIDGVDDASGHRSTLEVGQDIFVGLSSTAHAGNLMISNGGLARSGATGTIGRSVGATGNVSVTGVHNGRNNVFASELSTGALAVGMDGVGRLDVADGGITRPAPPLVWTLAMAALVLAH